MNLLKRIKNVMEISKFKPTDKVAIKVDGEPVFTLEKDEPLGDGNAVFLGEGTEEEWKEQEKEDRGFKGIFGL